MSNISKKERKQIIKNHLEENGYQEKGSYIDFCDKIKRVFNLMLSDNTLFNDSEVISVEDDSVDDLKIFARDIRVKDWKSCSDEDLKSKMIYIIEQSKSVTNNKTVRISDSCEQVGAQNFDRRAIARMSNDNICFYISYSDKENVLNMIDTEVEDGSNDTKLTLSNDYLFTVYLLVLK